MGKERVFITQMDGTVVHLVNHLYQDINDVVSGNLHPDLFPEHHLCSSYMIPVDVVPRVSAGRLVIGI